MLIVDLILEARKRLRRPLIERFDNGLSYRLKRAVDIEDWPSAGTNLNRIRQIIRVNLPLGLLVVIIGGSGRYWS